MKNGPKLMKTIREEITRITSQDSGCVFSLTADEMTDKILKIVEKRIDILLEDAEKRYQNGANPMYIDGEQSSLQDLKALLK